MVGKHPGVVHQHVDPLHRMKHLFDQPLRLFRPGEIGLEDLVGVAQQSGERGLRTCAVGVVMDRDAVSLAGKHACDRLADAARSAGDQDNSPLCFHVPP